MSDKEQVRNAGIRSAIIVDDGYDEIPQVDELLDEDGWESFFDDAQGEAAVRIEAIFPNYSLEGREDLKLNQSFIDALWAQRKNIGDLLGDLFETYEQKIEEIRPFLTRAESALTSLGIPFDKCGRDFVEAATEVDLIVIDLFLGIQQREKERKFTVDKLNEVIERRRDRELPSIILMSQVPSIGDLAEEFRQDVKLHASAFRQIRKGDLQKSGRMEGLILTLASHRSDSQALANFVDKWVTNAVEAAETAADTLRKIDIDDLQHIRNMLLRFEGLNASSYMLDVFDRVLQYEIESHTDVLEAATILDEVGNDPAPLMISNGRDTYAVLEQTIFVNPKRRNHDTGAEWPIAFGDILGAKLGATVESGGFIFDRDKQVFFVASPECDLIREDGLTTALLVTGILMDIDLTKPGLAVTAESTPILVLDGDRRFQVSWDFGNLRTINLDEAKHALDPDYGHMSIVARLREGSALNLRQQLLSNIGRVGELAPLPRSFRFRADLHVPLQEGGVQPIAMPDDVEITGNAIIPRRGRFATMIIDSNCEEDLTAVLLDLDLDIVSSKSMTFIKTLKEQTRIRQIFRSGFQGIVLPLNEPRSAGLLKIGVEQPETDDKRPKIDKVVTIVDGKATEEMLTNINNDAGLILRVYLET